MIWFEQGLAGQGRVGQDQTILGIMKHGCAILGRSGHGCQDWAEVIRTEQGSAGLGSSGQNWAWWNWAGQSKAGLGRTGQDWAGLGRGESIAAQSLGLWKELMKKENALWFQQSLETAFPKLILPGFQEAACPFPIPF